MTTTTYGVIGIAMMLLTVLTPMTALHTDTSGRLLSAKLGLAAMSFIFGAWLALSAFVLH